MRNLFEHVSVCLDVHVHVCVMGAWTERGRKNIFCFYMEPQISKVT